MRRGHTTEIYRPRQMYDIGNGDMVSCTYDFSEIPDSYYEGFFNGLPQLLYKKVKTVRFCNDAILKIEKQHDATDSELKNFKKTIKYCNSNYSHYLAKIIWRVLPRSKLLNSLTLDRIPLRSDEFRNIADSARKCKSLRSITFSNIDIKDEDFVYFIEKVSPYRLERIEFTNCQLTADIYNTVLEFIKRPPPQGKGTNMVNSDWKLKVFNLDRNDLAPENLDIIDAMMQKKVHPNDSDDQATLTTGEGLPFYRGNQKRKQADFTDRAADLSISNHDDELFEEEEEEEAELEDESIPEEQQVSLRDPRLNTTSQAKIEEIKRISDSVNPASPSDDPRRLNANLKKELNQLIEKLHAVKYSDDVFLIGDNAEKNLRDIRTAENQIRAYEKEHGEIEV